MGISKPKRKAEDFLNRGLEESFIRSLNKDNFYKTEHIIYSGALPHTWEDYLKIKEAVEQGESLPVFKYEIAPATDPIETAEKLTGLYQLRMVADLYQDGMANITDGGIDVDNHLNDLVDSLTKIRQIKNEAGFNKPVSLIEMVPEIKDRIAESHKLHKSGKLAGIPTGIKKLDNILGGLKKGLHILGAGPGQGKTTLCLQFAVHAAGEGIPVIFITFEEDANDLGLKAMCQRTNRNDTQSKDYLDGRNEPDNFERIALEFADEKFMHYLHFLPGTSKLAVSDVKAYAIRLMSTARADRCLIVIDYLQRWAAANKGNRDFRLAVANLAGEVQEMAVSLSCPVLMISSLNRLSQTGGNIPDINSFKESGDIEYHTDNAYVLKVNHEDEIKKRERFMTLHVVKHRKGSLCEGIDLLFKAHIGVFEEV